jgi:DNA replication protein DnaC
VLVTELDARRQRYLKTRLQLAHLPYVKTFEPFDFGFPPSLDERQVRELRTLRFVQEASNVILLARISHEEVAKGLISWHNWFI